MLPLTSISPFAIAAYFLTFLPTITLLQLTKANPLPPLPKLTCMADPRPPDHKDCALLIIAMYAASVKPGYRGQKRYGYDQHDNSSSAKLPKNYYLGRTGPDAHITTCMIHLDEYTRPGFPNWDEFSFGSLAIVTERMTTICLIREWKTGLDFPGKLHTVYARLLRYNGPGTGGWTPPMNDLGGEDGLGGESSEIDLGNETVILRSVDATLMPKNPTLSLSTGDDTSTS